MKRFSFRILALILPLTILLTGCDLLDKADDVTFDTVLEVNWVADENGDGTMVEYVAIETADLEGNAEIAKYINKIEKIKINKITYAVTSYDASPHNSAVIMTDGYASFAVVGASAPIVSVPYAATASGVNLQTATAETQLNIDEEGLTDIADAFLAEKELSMISEGILSVTPVAFTVKSKFYVTITAGALD